MEWNGTDLGVSSRCDSLRACRDMPRAPGRLHGTGSPVVRMRRGSFTGDLQKKISIYHARTNCRKRRVAPCIITRQTMVEHTFAALHKKSATAISGEFCDEYECCIEKALVTACVALLCCMTRTDQKSSMTWTGTTPGPGQTPLGATRPRAFFLLSTTSFRSRLASTSAIYHICLPILSIFRKARVGSLAKNSGGSASDSGPLFFHLSSSLYHPGTIQPTTCCTTRAFLVCQSFFFFSKAETALARQAVRPCRSLELCEPVIARFPP